MTDILTIPIYDELVHALCEDSKLIKVSSSSCCSRTERGICFPGIERVVFSDPATTVFFDDGTKVTVKTSANDKFDRERGVVYAIVKRLFGQPNDKNPSIIDGAGFGSKLNKIVAEGYDQNLKCKVKDIDPDTGKAKVVEKPQPQPAKASSKPRGFKRRVMDALDKIAASVQK